MNNCAICSKKFENDDLNPLMLIRDSLWFLILSDHPDVSRDLYICDKDYKKYHTILLNKMINKKTEEFSDFKKEVVDSIKDHDILSENINESYEENLSFGARLADIISSFGGSWKFIFIFFGFMIGWMITNTYILMQEQFDPYPYILLNLMLSCLAAVQAPIIMMSQNRRSERDRIQSENDYKINLKSELQIRLLNAKLDRFINVQWNSLVEIKKEQDKIIEKLNKSKNK